MLNKGITNAELLGIDPDVVCVTKSSRKRKQADIAAVPSLSHTVDTMYPFVAAMKSHRPFGI